MIAATLIGGFQNLAQAFLIQHGFASSCHKISKYIYEQGGDFPWCRRVPVTLQKECFGLSPTGHHQAGLLFFLTAGRGTHDAQPFYFLVGGDAQVHMIPPNRPTGVLCPVGMKCTVSIVYCDGTSQGGSRPGPPLR